MRVHRLGAETRNTQSPCIRVSGRARWGMEGEVGEGSHHCACFVKLLLFQTMISYRFRESPTKLLLFWTPGSGDIIQFLSIASVWTRHLGELSCSSWPAEPPSPNPVLVAKAKGPTRQRAEAGSGEAGMMQSKRSHHFRLRQTWPVGNTGRVLWQSHRII